MTTERALEAQRIIAGYANCPAKLTVEDDVALVSYETPVSGDALRTVLEFTSDALREAGLPIHDRITVPRLRGYRVHFTVQLGES